MDDKNKYKEALEKLQNALAPKDGCEISGLTRGCIESIFPELKESEDERIRKEIISALKWANHNGVYDKHLAWLEKQEEKPQGKSALEAAKEEKVDNANKIEQNPAWSEEDEKMFGYALDMIEWYSGKNEDKSRLVSDWLKSLKDRVQPQPKQEWSEEDEKNLKRIIWYVENPALNVVKDTMLSEWLKSIKERIKGCNNIKTKLIDIINKAVEWWLIHDSYSKDTNNLVNDFKKDLLKYVDISE